MNMLERQGMRVRAKSVMLASYRKQPNEWSYWLRWETFKAFVPAILVLAPHAFGWVTIPPSLAFCLIGAGLVWWLFVGWNAWAAFRRLDKKRRALLQNAGVECDFVALFKSRRAWTAALQGKTMREVLDDPTFESSALEKR